MDSHRFRSTGALALAAGVFGATSLAALGGGAAAGATRSPNAPRPAVATARTAAAPATRSRAAASCTGTVGVEAPITGEVAVIGLQQLHWAQYAATVYNKANGTSFRVVQGDTMFQPAQATVVTQQFLSNSSILAVVGPSSSAEVEAVGPLMKNAGVAFISASATSDSLFDGQYPTFFSVAAKNGQEGPYNARFIAQHLKAKNVAVIDDQSAYSVELANLAQTAFKRFGVTYTRLSVNQSEIDYSAVISKIPSKVTVAYLPWQVAGNAELFAQQLVQAHRHITIVGSDGVSSPSEFYANGDYVTSFTPDLTQNRADASLVKQYLATYHGAVGTYGPPEYVAMMVALNAISAACKSGKPTRASVLNAVRATNLSTSLLGTPVRFNKYGLMTTARFYMFEVKNKTYVEVS